MPFRNPFAQESQVELPAPVRAAIKQRLIQMIEAMPVSVTVLRERDLRNHLVVHGVPGVEAKWIMTLKESTVTTLLLEAGFEEIPDAIIAAR